jgi:hypothetical protein
MRGNAALQPGAGVDATRVVEAGSAVEVLIGAGACLVNAVGETVAIVRTGGSLADHLGDDTRRARRLNLAGQVRVAGSVAVVALHETWIADTVVGGVDAYAAAGLLEHDGKDEAVVNTSLPGDLLDRVPDGALVTVTLARI